MPDAETCAARLQRRFGPHVLCEVVPLSEDPPEPAPEERQAVARAVPARRREFAAGRACAHRLLQRLGFPDAPLLPAPDRSPAWPRGAVGSIAHGGGLCAVAVARAGPLAALGLDVEPDEPLEESLWPTICTVREREALAGLPASRRGRRARLLFSAKECAYKCLAPAVGRVLEFHELEIELLPDADLFRATLRKQAPALEGFHLSCAGAILTGMTLPPVPG